MIPAVGIALLASLVSPPLLAAETADDRACSEAVTALSLVDGRVVADTLFHGTCVLEDGRWRHQDDRAVAARTPDRDHPRLAPVGFQRVAHCAGGERWLAGAGPLVLEREPGGRWREHGPAHGLPPSQVTTVACAGPGAAWVGTLSAGLGRLDAEGWRPVEGLAGRRIFAIEIDGDRLWVGTADGLLVWKEGVALKVADGPVYAVLKDGDRIWTAGPAGIAVIGEEERGETRDVRARRGTGLGS